jgi:two-component system NarL family response regulator
MNNLVIASIDEDRIVSCKKGLDEFVITAIATDRLDRVWDCVERVKPEVLLLDMDLIRLQSSNSVGNLRKLCAETKTIIMCSAISEITEWELIKAGVRGCYRNDIKSALLKQVVMAVKSGELWIRRTLTARLVDELGKTTSKNKAYRASLGLLNKLSQREFDIAVHVSNGYSNKQIAELCSISESTVKFHISEIFQKLGVDSRLNLALILSADNTSTFANSDPNSSGNLAQLIQDNAAEQLIKRAGMVDEQSIPVQDSPDNDRSSKK